MTSIFFSSRRDGDYSLITQPDGSLQWHFSDQWIFRYLPPPPPYRSPAPSLQNINQHTCQVLDCIDDSSSESSSDDEECHRNPPRSNIVVMLRQPEL